MLTPEQQEKMDKAMENIRGPRIERSQADSPTVIEGYIRPSAVEVVISLLLENSLLIIAAVVVAAVLISGA